MEGGARKEKNTNGGAGGKNRRGTKKNQGKEKGENILGLDKKKRECSAIK